MASFKQREELPEGNFGPFEELSPTEPTFQHKNHWSGRSKMDSALGLGGPHLAPRDGAGRNFFKIQTNIQGPTPTRMQLARGKEQRRDGMHHPSSYRYGN
jgi:hypothetical protein